MLAEALMVATSSEERQLLIDAARGRPLGDPQSTSTTLWNSGSIANEAMGIADGL
jgi:hypothetical protein